MKKKNNDRSFHKECFSFHKETLKEKENAICFGRLLNRQVEHLHIKASTLNISYSNMLVEKESCFFFLSIEMEYFFFFLLVHSTRSAVLMRGATRTAKSHVPGNQKASAN